MNFEIFTTKKFENYRYQISKIRNKGDLSNLDNVLINKGEKAIDYNKKITRFYYILEFLFLIKKYKYLNNMKYVWGLSRIVSFSLIFNLINNLYLDKNLSKYLIMNKIEDSNLQEFQSFISHKNK